MPQPQGGSTLSAQTGLWAAGHPQVYSSGSQLYLDLYWDNHICLVPVSIQVCYTGSHREHEVMCHQDAELPFN